MSLVEQIQREKENELEKVSTRFAFVGFARSSNFIEDFLKSTKLQDERLARAKKIEEIEAEILRVAQSGGDTQSLSEILASERQLLAKQTEEYKARLSGIQSAIAEGGALLQSQFKKVTTFDRFKLKKIKLNLNPQGIFSSKIGRKIEGLKAASEGVLPTSELT